MVFSAPLIAWTEKGLYCEAGDFYIDPHRAVQTAVITHAHSDHARRGSDRYICTPTSVGLLRSRLGKNICVQSVPFRESFVLGNVKVSFHSAGHILGSAQVRVESQGEVWVASGDYKREPDPSCEAFEPVACDTFITEATFGTPKYVWRKDLSYGQLIYNWWKQNAREGFNSLLFGYSLGKAQRILAELAPLAVEKPIVVHSSVEQLTECYRQEGRLLAPTRVLQTPADLGGAALEAELILAPPSVLKLDQSILGHYKTAFASGWMVQNTHFRRDYDHGFVMSDHADWTDLNRTIDESGAKRIFVQHRDGALVRHLRRRGLEAHPSEMLTRENYSRMGGTTLRLL
jgi:putative mRNA 3-end processing factor